MAKNVCSGAKPERREGEAGPIATSLIDKDMCRSLSPTTSPGHGSNVLRHSLSAARVTKLETSAARTILLFKARHNSLAILRGAPLGRAPFLL